MSDIRVRVFSRAVDDLVASLEALLRLARWVETEPRPEPLLRAASKLPDRIVAAQRLFTEPFIGPPADMIKVDVLCGKLRRLDAAYKAYDSQVGSAEAAAALEIEIAEATASSS